MWEVSHMLNIIMIWLCYKAVSIRPYIDLICSVVFLIRNSLFRKVCRLIVV